MKTLLLALAVLFSQHALAADHDGNWYVGLDTNTRTTYLIGLADGAAMIGNHARYSLCLPITSPNYTKCGQEVTGKLTESYFQYTDNVTIGQLQNGLDTMFADYRNRSLSVTTVIHVVLRSISGMPAQEVNSWLELLRAGGR